MEGDVELAVGGDVNGLAIDGLQLELIEIGHLGKVGGNEGDGDADTAVTRHGDDMGILTATDVHTAVTVTEDTEGTHILGLQQKDVVDDGDMTVEQHLGLPETEHVKSPVVAKLVFVPAHSDKVEPADMLELGLTALIVLTTYGVPHHIGTADILAIQELAMERQRAVKLHSEVIAVHVDDCLTVTVDTIWIDAVGVEQTVVAPLNLLEDGRGGLAAVVHDTVLAAKHIYCQADGLLAAVTDADHLKVDELTRVAVTVTEDDRGSG